MCVSDLCGFLTRTSIVQSKSLTTPPIRTTKVYKDASLYTVQYSTVWTREGGVLRVTVVVALIKDTY